MCLMLLNCLISNLEKKYKYGKLEKRLFSKREWGIRLDAVASDCVC